MGIILIYVTFLERNVLENMARSQGCNDILRSGTGPFRLQISGL